MEDLLFDAPVGKKLGYEHDEVARSDDARGADEVRRPEDDPALRIFRILAALQHAEEVGRPPGDLNEAVMQDVLYRKHPFFGRKLLERMPRSADELVGAVFKERQVVKAFRHALHGADDGIEIAGAKLHGPVVRDLVHFDRDARRNRRDPGDGGREEENAVIDPSDVKVSRERLRVEVVLFEEPFVVVKEPPDLGHQVVRAPGGGESPCAAREKLIIKGFPELCKEPRGRRRRNPQLIGRIHQVLRLIEGLEENESVAVQCFFHFQKIEYSKSDRSP